MRRPLLLCLLALVVTAAPARAGVPDPAAPGPWSVTKVEYDAGSTFVSDPSGLSYAQELNGSLHVPSGRWTSPVIVLLHGRHSTCAYVGIEAVGSPCPETVATSEVRSYEGYDYLARNLASHGYLVMSVDANAINTFDAAGDKGGAERAQLLARSLDLLAEWNRAAGPGDVGDKLVGRVDLSRIGMMGHSRGGGGVSNFVGYNATRTDGPRYRGLKAVISLAGTDYNVPVVHGVTYGALLPYCDGDVYDLQAAFTWDRSRFADPREPGARVQFAVQGGNHNFFNTVWTGDDYSGSDPACDSGAPGNVRLTPADERRVGLVVLGAFLRRYVGPEPAFQPLMTGAAALPASACPKGERSCSHLVQTSYLAPAAAHLMVVGPRMDAHALDRTAAGLPLRASALTKLSFCDPHADSGADGGNRDPGTASGCPTNPDRSRARQLSVAWDRPSALRAELGDLDASRFSAVYLRAGYDFDDTAHNPPSLAAQDFDVALVDTRGRSESERVGAWSNALDAPLGAADRELVMNGVWIPLQAFHGVDERRLAAVELRFGRETPTGALQLAELGFQRG